MRRSIEHITARGREPAPKLQVLAQQPLLAMGYLKALRQGQGVGGRRQKGRQPRHTEALGPGQPEKPLTIGLQSAIEQAQPPPALEQEQSLPPVLPLQQQFELHAQAGAEGRWGLVRRIAMAPAPRPGGDGGSRLLKAGWIQDKSKPRRIASSAEESAGVVSQGIGVEEPQTPGSQVNLAAMGIKQGGAAIGLQQQRHGVDTEITPSQITLEASWANNWILPGVRIAFRPCGSQIQE